MRLSRNKIQKALKKRKESYKRFRKRKKTDTKLRKTARKRRVINLRNKTVKKYGKRVHKGGAAGPAPVQRLNNILAGDNDIPFPKDGFFKRFSLAQLKEIMSNNSITLTDDASNKKTKAPYINAIKQRINEKRREVDRTSEPAVVTPRPRRRLRPRPARTPAMPAVAAAPAAAPAAALPTIATQTETVPEQPETALPTSESVPMKSPQITAYTVKVDSVDQPGMGWLNYRVVDKDGKKHVKTAEEMLYLLQHGTSDNVSVHKFEIKSGIATQSSNPEDKKSLIDFLNRSSPSSTLIQKDDINVLKIAEPVKKPEEPAVEAVPPPTAPPESPTAPPESPLFPPAPTLPSTSEESAPSVPVLFPPLPPSSSEKENIEKRVQKTAQDRVATIQAAKDTAESAQTTEKLLARAREVSRKAKKDNPETLGNIESLGGGGRSGRGGRGGDSGNNKEYAYILWIRHCFGCHNKKKLTFGINTGYTREPLCTDKGIVESVKFGNKLPEKLQEYKTDGKLPETINKISFNSSVLPRAMQTMLLVERAFMKKNEKTKDESKRFRIPDHEVHRVNYVQEKYVRGVESVSNSSRNVTHRGKSDKHAKFYNKTIGKGLARVNVDNIIGDYPDSNAETVYKFSSDDYSRFKQTVIPELTREHDSDKTVFAIVSHGQYLRRALGFDEKLKNLDAVLVRYPIDENGRTGEHEILDRYNFNREVMNTVSPMEYSRIIELVQQTGLDTKFMNCTYSYNNDIVPIADSQSGGKKTRKNRKH